MPDNPFEIPQSMRDASQRNLEQAHAAYEQLIEFMTKAMDAWMGAMPAYPMTTSFKDVQGRAVEIAKENGELAFALAEKMTKAHNFQEVLTLQTQFAQDRMQAFTTQTQELFRLIGDSLQKSGRA